MGSRLNRVRETNPAAPFFPPHPALYLRARMRPACSGTYLFRDLPLSGRFSSSVLRPTIRVTNLKRRSHMIGVVVTFRFGEKFDEPAIRNIAETARGRFEG